MFPYQANLTHVVIFLKVVKQPLVWRTVVAPFGSHVPIASLLGRLILVDECRRTHINVFRQGDVAHNGICVCGLCLLCYGHLFTFCARVVRREICPHHSVQGYGYKQQSR